MSITQEVGQIATLLYEEPFRGIFGELVSWRIDPYIRQLEKEKKKGRIFPFVRGLRLSARLIYVIRDILSETNLTANWGQLLDEQGKSCSCECDIIIHHKGHERRWNGTDQPVMDFRFIKQQNAIAVISCKSYLRSGDVDTEYCESMKPFCKNIWLFAECCGSRSAKNIRQKALSFGYKKFWYLYSWSKKTDPQPNRDGWSDFVKEAKKLMQ
jgi:hypothetical protein